MINILYDKIEEFNPIPITDELIDKYPLLNLERLPEYRRDLLSMYYNQGKWYYCKPPFEYDIKAFLLNELIGMYYAKLLAADTVEYLIKKRINKINQSDPYDLLLLSENFWTPNTVSAYSFFNEDKSMSYKEEKELVLKVRDVSKIKNDRLDNGVMKMTAIDIVMNQTDRSPSNCNLVLGDKEAILGKLFDYELSYVIHNRNPKSSIYINPFLVVKLSKEGIIKLLETYKCAYPIFKSISLIELRYILSEIEKDYPIIISEKHKQVLYKKDRFYRKIIKEII